MTEQQLDAIKSLAERYNSTLEHTDVHHSPFDLPAGWITVNIKRPDNTIIIHAGISPAGRIST